jgi:hypothetical protein
MDREVIEQKLESLRRCLQRVAEKCPSDPATLGRDPDLQDIVTLYEVIDWAIVHGLALNHVSDFSEFTKVIAFRLAR